MYTYCYYPDYDGTTWHPKQELFEVMQEFGVWEFLFNKFKEDGTRDHGPSIKFEMAIENIYGRAQSVGFREGLRQGEDLESRRWKESDVYQRAYEDGWVDCEEGKEYDDSNS